MSRKFTNKGVNMDIETITKLIDAGYTKEEIKALEGGVGNPSGAAGNEDGAGNEPHNEGAGKIEGNANEENASKVNNPVDFGAALEALTNTVNGLTTTVKAMQDANVKNASGGKAENSTVDDVMKSFIDTL